MVAVPAKGEPTSLIENIVLWFAKLTRRRAARTGKTTGTGVVAWWTAELFGTVAAFATFTYGAFLYLLPGLGYAVLGVSVLVLDSKISTGRRKRRAAAAELTVVPAQQQTARPAVWR